MCLRKVCLVVFILTAPIGVCAPLNPEEAKYPHGQFRVFDVSAKALSETEGMQTFAIKSTKNLARNDTRMLFTIRHQGYELPVSRKVLSRLGEGILVDTSLFSGYEVTRVETEIFQADEQQKRRTLIRLSGVEGDVYELVVTGNQDFSPLLNLTDDYRVLASNWDYPTKLNLRDLMDSSSPNRTTTPPNNQGATVAISFCFIAIANVLGEVCWVASALDYSAHGSVDRPALYYFRGLSWLLGFPWVPLQELVGQSWYYWHTGKFAGLELIKFYGRSRSHYKSIP